MRRVFIFLVCLIAWAQCGCTVPAAPSKDGTREDLKAWCDKHHNLPIYPNLSKISFPQVKNLPQVSMFTSDDLAKVNDWYLHKLSRGVWKDWKLLKAAGMPEETIYYELHKPTGDISVFLTDTKDKRLIQYVINGPGWQSDGFVPVAAPPEKTE